MLEVRMLNDIRKYEPKLLGPFTARQLICVLIAVPIFVLLLILLPIDNFLYRVIAALVPALPPIMCGYVKVGNMHMEKYVMRVVYKNYLTPRKRAYKVENSLKKEFTKKDKISEEEFKQMSKKEKKEYQKQQNKKKEINYKTEITHFC